MKHLAVRTQIASSLNAIVAHPSRRAIEDAIERLIDLLDRTDPDPDFEPQGDEEPSLGSLERRSQLAWSGGNCDDLEPLLGWSEFASQTGRPDRRIFVDEDVEEADLGSLDGQIDQRKWWWGRNDGAEPQCDDEGAAHADREDEGDSEPICPPFDPFGDKPFISAVSVSRLLRREKAGECTIIPAIDMRKYQPAPPARITA